MASTTDSDLLLSSFEAILTSALAPATNGAGSSSNEVLSTAFAGAPALCPTTATWSPAYTQCYYDTNGQAIPVTPTTTTIVSSYGTVKSTIVVVSYNPVNSGLKPSPSISILPDTSSLTQYETGASLSPGTSPSATPIIPQSSSIELSTPAKAGIGVGVTIAAFLIIGTLFFFLRWRKRALKSQVSQGRDVHEKGLDNAETKPELTGSMPVRSGPYVPYDKPELSTRKKTITESTSTSSWMQSSSANSGSQQPQMFYDQITPVTSSVPPPEGITQSDINFLKAQERELAHKVEVNESLIKLKAEHLALQERIRLAEMYVREVNERS